MVVRGLSSEKKKARLLIASEKETKKVTFELRILGIPIFLTSAYPTPESIRIVVSKPLFCSFSTSADPKKAEVGSSKKRVL